MGEKLIDYLIERAKQSPKRVALPECEADKTLQAAQMVLTTGIGWPVLVGEPAVIKETAQRAGVSLEGMEIRDPSDCAAGEKLLAAYMAAGGRKWTEEEYRQKLSDPMYYAMMLEAVGEVECTFCGHVNTTGAVLKAALAVIGLQPGVDVASVLAMVDAPLLEGPEGNLIAMADCALNPQPTAEKLASIAIASARTVEALMGWEPRVAFLSFSTDGSGRSESVDTVRRAIEVARERCSEYAFDGEFQLDTAIMPDVAAKKLGRSSDVAGKANVLIFPNLDAANIGIKLIQLFAKGKAYGHTLSGFSKPVADSSRGASVEEMLGDIAMAILAAGGR